MDIYAVTRSFIDTISVLIKQEVMPGTRFKVTKSDCGVTNEGAAKDNRPKPTDIDTIEIRLDDVDSCVNTGRIKVLIADHHLIYDNQIDKRNMCVCNF